MSTTKKLLLIINPTAGKRLAKDYTLRIINKFDAAGYHVTTCCTQINKNACDIVLNRGKDFDLIVCCGGDGTLKETICGVTALGLNTRIGYIPLGTTNDFAHSVRIPTDAVMAANAVVCGKEMSCDLGDFNGAEQFIYVSCFGNFCDVSYKAPQKLKNKIGRQAYYLETAKELLKIKGYKAKIECDDGEIIEGEFFYGGVSNSYSIAGFPVLENAGVSFNDGYHELALIKMPKTPSQLSSIISAMLKKEVLDNEYIIVKRGKSFKFYFDEPVPWTLDGEYGGDHSYAEINNIEKAITILVSSDEYVSEQEENFSFDE
ncbi:MAG: diacylglycerol/lipid kinase family protein [Candidatus Fimenecus sp.]